MKKILLGIITCVILSISFSSCTVEKRVHQDGFHISWKHRRTDANEQSQLSKNIDTEEKTVETIYNDSEPNVHSALTLSANSAEGPDLILPSKKTLRAKLKADTIVPTEQKQQEEYYRNSYLEPIYKKKTTDVKLANWALGLGIAAFTSPVWISLLFLLIFALMGASWASISIWTAIGLAILIGGGIFITLEVLAITFAIRYLRTHGKNPYYRKYRSRAITGLILAGIYPAIMILNIIIGLALL
jgi:uncharacterized protein YxeA